MTHDEALAIYNTGSKVVVKTLCDLSNTIELQKAQITELEVKIAKLSKNSSNSSKPPSSDEITKAKKGGKGKKGGQPGHPRHERPLFPEEAINTFNSYQLDDCPDCGGQTILLDLPPRITQQIELKEIVTTSVDFHFALAKTF